MKKRFDLHFCSQFTFISLNIDVEHSKKCHSSKTIVRISSINYIRNVITNIFQIEWI